MNNLPKGWERHNDYMYYSLLAHDLDGMSMSDLLLMLETKCSEAEGYCKEPLRLVFEASFGELERLGIQGELL